MTPLSIGTGIGAQTPVNVYWPPASSANSWTAPMSITMHVFVAKVAKNACANKSLGASWAQCSLGQLMQPNLYSHTLNFTDACMVSISRNMFISTEAKHASAKDYRGIMGPRLLTVAAWCS